MLVVCKRHVITVYIIATLLNHILLVVAETKEQQLSDIVNLELRSTACGNVCFFNEKADCPSSIIVNGEERSLQKDGFNVLVIDTFSGEITHAHFKWFSQVALLEWQGFLDFFKTLHTACIVVIVFQNMCRQFHKRWFTLLSQHAQIRISNVYKGGSYRTAVMVGCKVSCPQVTEGNIPYTHFGWSKKSSVVIRYKLKTVSNDKDIDIAVIAGGVTGAIVLVGLVYFYYLYRRERHENRNLGALLYDTTNETVNNGNNTNCVNSYISPEKKNDPVYEEIRDQVLFERSETNEQKHDHIYADPNDLIIRTTEGNCEDIGPRQPHKYDKVHEGNEEIRDLHKYDDVSEFEDSHTYDEASDLTDVHKYDEPNSLMEPSAPHISLYESTRNAPSKSVVT